MFLLDEQGDYVTVRAGTGEAGRVLREQGYRLKIGDEGIVGWVAGHRRALRVDDVTQDTRRLPLSVIPDTRSELGLPLEPFVLAVLFGANLSFVTPMAYKTNLLVMNAGGYKFGDFMRVGIPLTVMMWWLLTMVLAFAYRI